MSKIGINWGIIGLGRIANNFASSFHQVPSANLYAVASRDLEKSKDFARQYQSIQHCYGSYLELVQDANVDVIYIATPHSFHHEVALLCMRHKKAVLCEKPLTLNRHLALEMVEWARANQVFLMEAMWTRFFPATLKVLELIEKGAVGEIKYVRSDFGFKTAYDPESRLFDLALGGGALLDIGVYPLFLALLLLGRPDKIQAMAHLASSGADDFTSAMFEYKTGSYASILCTTNLNTPKTAEIMGTEGSILLHEPWYRSSAVTLKGNNGEIQHFDLPYQGHGSSFQIEEVMLCLENGKLESELMPLKMSLMMAEVSDEIRRQCGIVYPVDEL